MAAAQKHCPSCGQIGKHKMVDRIVRPNNVFADKKPGEHVKVCTQALSSSATTKGTVSIEEWEAAKEKKRKPKADLESIEKERKHFQELARQQLDAQKKAFLESEKRERARIREVDRAVERAAKN